MLKAADIFQPDPAFCGGISEAMRIGTIASAFNLRFAPHLWAGAPCFFAGLHVCAASPASFIVEYSLGANPMIHDLVEETIEVKDGMIAIPDRPGLGFTISESFLEAHAQELTMKENNLLAELAAYLFSRSNSETNRTPSERELAEHFSVSRGQIRESLAILEAMRIVERRAKSGIYLTTRQASVEAMALFAKAGVPLDPIQIYETVELRKIHEIKAAELACSRATEENYERLREILKDSEERLAAGQPLAREDRDFHLEIVRATQNSVFHQICSVYYVMGEDRLPSISAIPSAAAGRMPSICRSSTRCCAATAIWRRR